MWRSPACWTPPTTRRPVSGFCNTLSADIAWVKARMGWSMPRYSMTARFDAGFCVDEWHGEVALWVGGSSNGGRQPPARGVDSGRVAMRRARPAAGSAWRLWAAVRGRGCTIHDRLGSDTMSQPHPDAAG